MRRSVLSFSAVVTSGGVCILHATALAAPSAPYGPNPPPSGPYSPPAGQAGSTAIANTSPLFTEWASSFTNLKRGPQDIANPTGPLASYGAGTDALGPAEGNSANVVSLGDGGAITLSFDKPISNGNGADFAVFENSFSDTFLELAYVEVSSDGSNFVRFPAVSLTQHTDQINGFGSVDATKLYDLAGNFRQGFGTPFDLNELAGAAKLDINSVKYVRVLDVVGRITPVLDSNNNPVWSPSTDYFANIINDPYPTPFASGGFDLDGVGVINTAPEPAAGFVAAVPLLLLRRRRSRSNLRGMKMISRCMVCLALVTAIGGYARAAVITFSDKTLTPNSFYNGGPVTNSNGFSSGGAFFNNNFDSTFGSWNGWSISNIQNSTTPGFGNQYAAYPGSGFGGSGNYAVAYPDSFINLALGQHPTSVELTNTTYAGLSMLNGDSFAKKFGGASGNDPDYLYVTLTGYAGANETGSTTGTEDFYLADYRFADNTKDYILNTWTPVDLTPLGGADSIGLTFHSSDVGAFGINTPTYLALDNLTTAPEPAIGAVLVLAGAALLGRKRRA